MKSLRVFDGHLRYAVLAVTLVLAVVAPAFASAAQLTERSIALSSSSKAATGVSYNIKFTQTTNAGAAVIQFCTNSPLIGEFCDSPSGMVVTGATAGAGVTAVSSATGSTIKLTKSGATQDLTLTGITNPTASGTVFARILTYTDSTAADAYDVQSSTTNTLGSPIDQGAVAIAYTDTVAVSGAVLEALTFCVSGSALTSTDCTTGYSAPVLTLGDDVGNGVIALNPDNISTGDIFTKLSTNAVGGAIVSLKSTSGTSSCAGLALNGTGDCNIAAAGTTGTFSAGAGKFGVKLTLPTTNDDSDNKGIIGVATGYDTSDYRFDGTSIVGTYGDPLYNTSGGGVSNKDTKLTFGATAAPNTPAGKYSTSISLIATGTF